MAGDATAAESHAAGGGFDAILLDVMLPDHDGFTLCRRLRTRGIDTPIVLLTGRNALADRVHVHMNLGDGPRDLCIGERVCHPEVVH